MSQSPDTDEYALLDDCLDLMMQGRAWEEIVQGDDPTHDEIRRLMGVALGILHLARATPGADVECRRRIWNRANSVRGVIRRIAFYRLPYLPPLWIRPEAC